MALTRDAETLIVRRARDDAKFRHALLAEAVTAAANGEPDVAKAALRHVVKAGAGYGPVAERVGKTPESVMRMLADRGNPTLENLAAILHALSRGEGVEMTVSVRRAKPPARGAAGWPGSAGGTRRGAARRESAAPGERDAARPVSRFARSGGGPTTLTPQMRATSGPTPATRPTCGDDAGAGLTARQRTVTRTVSARSAGRRHRRSSHAWYRVRHVSL